MVGRLVRFDEARGYGFITPHAGGSDVFMHANEFLSDKQFLKPGTLVEFDTATGDRGLRAIAVRTVEGPAPGAGKPAPTLEKSTARTRFGPTEHAGTERTVTTFEFMHEVTEAIIEGAPTTTGQQIAQIRECLGEVARNHGWVLT
ncbi:cold shock domain-containing protein [Embleya sp. NPDC008237]|uniref:cold shock domain-containing protein n=1 Tax=Embleya sp. NPDC008237 TaxID=3363978 RepID=UPI0036E142AE